MATSSQFEQKISCCARPVTWAFGGYVSIASSALSRSMVVTRLAFFWGAKWFKMSKWVSLCRACLGHLLGKICTTRQFMALHLIYFGRSYSYVSCDAGGDMGLCSQLSTQTLLHERLQV